MYNNPYLNAYGQTYPQQQQQGGQLNWVQGEAAAKSYLVAPGTAVVLFDSEAKKFYIKSADQSGMPSMRTFEFKEISDAGAAPAVDLGKYVTRDEMEARIAEILKREVKDGE